MKKSLYLHIGMGKTGTTALQDFFWGNRKILIDHDIRYPKKGAVANAHHLLSPHIPRFLEGVWKFKRVEEWAPELVKSPQKRILLSSELIAWAEGDVVREFCTELLQWFDVKVIVYLRRQDNIIMASYNQQIKAGPQRRKLDVIYDKKIELFDYEKILAPWAESIGKKNLIVLPYEHGQFYDGDIRRDFMHRVFDIDLDDRFKLINANANPRLSQGPGEYKRMVNNLMSDEEKNARFNKLLMQYSAELDKNSTSVFSNQDALAPALRLKILEATREATEVVAREYMGREDGRMFYDPLPSVDEPWGGNELTPPEAEAITQYLERHDPKLMRWLGERVKEYWNSERPQERRAARVLGESVLGEDERPFDYALVDGDASPIVVGGLGGSGTRLVVSLLQDMGVDMGGELNESLDNMWFSLLFVRRSILLKSDDELRKLAWIFTNAMRHGKEFPRELNGLLEQACQYDRGPVLPKSLLEETRDSLLRATPAEDLDRLWGWKQPNSHVMVPQLLRCFRRMKYIYVVRNGLDMAFSENQNQLKYFWGDLILEGDTSVSPRNALRYWVASHKRMLGYKRFMGDRLYFLNFDRLCADPALELQRLQKFVGTDVSSATLSELAANIAPPATAGRFRQHDCSDLRPADVEFVKEQGFLVV